MTDAHGVARDQLRAFIERIERLEEEKKTVADDIKDVYAEAKGTGFDTKVLRRVIQIRKQDRDERAEQEAILDSYLAALGMIEQPSFFDDELRQSVPASREERRRQLMSEDMAVHKNLVDEMADAGLISEEARHENKALADAVARKFGNGPAMALQSPRKAAEAVSERTAITDATVAPVLVEANKAEAVAGELGQPETIPALTVQHDGVNVGGPERAGVTAGETATISPEEANEDSPSDDGNAAANAGGIDVDRNAERVPTNTTGEGTACALPINPDVIMEDVPPMPMKRTAFAHCFPELSNAAYERLGTDIAFKGVHDPIIRQGDVIVDGWARYNIARDLGISYPVQPYTGNDALLDVIEWQRASRNFTPAQEKKIAADLAKEFPHRADDIMAAFGHAAQPDNEVAA